MGGENLIKAVAVIGAGAAGNKFPKADDYLWRCQG